MGELVGFAAGVVAGALGALAVNTESGKRLRERLVSESEPDLRRALDEWDPLLREIARAVRLGAQEVERYAERARELLAELAEDAAATDGLAGPTERDRESGTTADGTAEAPAQEPPTGSDLSAGTTGR